MRDEEPSALSPHSRHGEVSPSLPLSLVGIPRYPALAVAPLSLQSSWWEKITVYQGLLMSWKHVAMLTAASTYLTTVCVQTMNSGLEFHWW